MTRRVGDELKFSSESMNRVINESKKAEEKLGWKAQITWRGLLAEMFTHDIETISKNSVLSI